MARRKKKQTAAVAPLPAHPHSPSARSGPELLRRGVLALVTALIVARPLMPGEDPGLLAPGSDPSGMLLTWLWLVAAVGWAAWRLWARQGGWLGGLVEVCLLGVVVLVFVSGYQAARYKYPALLIGWEWVGFLVAFCLVRQLAVTAWDQRVLLAVLAATAVMISAYALYQYAVELPALRARYGEGLEKLRAELDRTSIMHVEADDPALLAFAQRLQADNVYATFSHPNTLAGFLALFLPLTVGYGVAAWQHWRSDWKTWVAAGLAVLVAVALALTHSRGAVLATVLVGLPVAAWLGRSVLSRHRGRLAAGAAVMASILVLLLLLEPGRAALANAVRSLGLRLDYWRATWAMIGDHPWLGVGPGNFGREYPRYMLPQAYEKVQDPHNFALELWATSGLLAAAALLMALAVFFRRVVSGVRSTQYSVVSTRPAAEEKSPQYTLLPEYYIGGMVGLLIGFLPRAANLSQDEVLIEGLVAGARAVVWFAAFGLLERVEWRGPGRVVALTAGAAAFLLNLTVSGGIVYPAVATFLWVVMALALNLVRPPVPVWQARRWIELFLPLPLLAAVAVGYLVMIYYPAASSASLAQAAEADGQRLLAARSGAKPEPEDRRKPVRNFETFLVKQVLEPLDAAAKANPGDARLRVQLANWYRVAWGMYPRKHEYFDHGLDAALLAEYLDAHGRDGYLAEARLHQEHGRRLRFEAERRYAVLGAASAAVPALAPLPPLTWLAELYPTPLKPFRQNAHAHLELVAAALRHALELDPREARTHFELAEAFFEADHAELARERAKEAAALDAAAPHPTRELSERQRRQVQAWLGDRPPG